MKRPDSERLPESEWVLGVDGFRYTIIIIYYDLDLVTLVLEAQEPKRREGTHTVFIIKNTHVKNGGKLYCHGHSNSAIGFHRRKIGYILVFLN